MEFEDHALGPQPVPPAAEYQVCDPGELPSGQMARVRAIQETFLRAFAETLALRLETPVTAEIVSTEPLSGSEFLKSSDELGYLLTFEAERVRGQAFIALSAGLLAYLLRVLLEAPEAPADGSRAVTEIELHILREIFESLALEFAEAWKPSGIAFRWTPDAGEATAGLGTMLVFHCQLTLDNSQQFLHIAVPAFLARLAALESMPGAEEGAPGEVREIIFNALRRANLGVEAVLAGSTLRMKDLLAMERGHVLMLAQPVGSPLECRINGKPKFRGEWVAQSDRQALELL